MACGYYICAMNKKVILIILDGWGIATDKSVSAVDKAKTPFMDSLYGKYVNSTLEASGLAVGLPEGQMGNSEVGHMNIGAGRVVYQDLVKINKAAEEGTLAKEKELVAAFDYAKKEGKKIHFIGLVSDGGVHSAHQPPQRAPDGSGCQWLQGRIGTCLYGWPGL